MKMIVFSFFYDFISLKISFASITLCWNSSFKLVATVMCLFVNAIMNFISKELWFTKWWAYQL